MQQRLADLYLKTKRKKDAADIYIMAAQSMQIRGNFAGAQEALEKVLKIDPGHAEGLQLKAKVSSEAGDHGKAAQSLKSMPDLDSRPDALRQLLRAHVSNSDLDAAEAIAGKLAGVHKDPSAIRTVAEAWLAKEQPERAVRLLDQFADPLLASDKAALMKLLQSAVAKAKQNAPALELILAFYNRVEERGSVGDLMELLAHEYAESGNLQRSRDLYKQLSELEPDNVQHKQNYAQLSARIGSGATKPAASSPKAAAHVIPAEPEFGITHPLASSSAALPDFDKPLSQLKQEYSADTAEAIENALTDSDLFQSYNSIPRAITPLEAVLPAAPRDTRVNERLAQLYVRTERYGEAVARLLVLQSVFAAEGMQEDAQQCAVLAQTCRTRGGLPTPVAAPAASTVPDTTVERQFSPASATEAAFRAERLAEAEAEALPESVPAELPTFEVAATTSAADIFSRAANPETVAPHEFPGWDASTATDAAAPPDEEPAEPDRLSDALDEARFYISQGMRQEAQAALERCEQITPKSPEIADLKAQLARMSSAPAPSFTVAPAEPVATVEEEPEELQVEIEIEADEADNAADSDWGEVVEEAEEAVAAIAVDEEIAVVEPEEPPRKRGKEKAPEKPKHAPAAQQPKHSPAADKGKHAPGKDRKEKEIADFDDVL